MHLVKIVAEISSVAEKRKEKVQTCEARDVTKQPGEKGGVRPSHGAPVEKGGRTQAAIPREVSTQWQRWPVGERRKKLQFIEGDEEGAREGL